MSLYKRTLKTTLPDGTVESHRSPTWYYDFTYRGRRHTGCTGLEDKPLARKYQDHKEAEARLGQRLDGPRPPRILPTFKESALAYLAGDGKLKRSADADRSILTRALIPFFGSKRLDAIERADVERFRNDRLAGQLSDTEPTSAVPGAPARARNRKASPAPATVHRELALLKRIINVAVDAQLLESESCRSRNKAGVHEGAHLRPMMLLAYETGMREGEIRDLRWADVDFKNHVARLSQTKNGTARRVPLTEKAEAALKAWVVGIQR